MRLACSLILSCSARGVTSLYKQIACCLSQWNCFISELVNASIIKKAFRLIYMGDAPLRTAHNCSTFECVCLSVCVCVCVCLKGNHKLLCEQFNLWKQKGVRTKIKHNKSNKNEKEMKWIEKIEKFYLLQVSPIATPSPLSARPTDCFVAVWQGGKRQLHVATSSGNGNGKDLLLFCCCSQRKRE